MVQPQQEKTFAQALSELEIFGVLHCSPTSKPRLSATAFRQEARTKIRPLKEAAKTEKHHMSLTDMKRLIQCGLSLAKVDELKDVNELRLLWDMVEATVVAVADEAAIKSPINRFEDLAAILSVLNTIDKTIRPYEPFEDSLAKLMIGIGQGLLEDLKEAERHQFFTLTNAIFKCWPTLLIMEASQINILMDVVRSRVEDLVPRRVHGAIYCGIDQPIDDRADESIDNTQRQQHQAFKKLTLKDEDLREPTGQTEEGLAIMQLRQQIQDLKVEKQQMAMDHKKVMEEYYDEMDLLKTTWHESASAGVDLKGELKRKEAEVKGLKELLVEIEDEKMDLQEELAGVKARFA